MRAKAKFSLIFFIGVSEHPNENVDQQSNAKNYPSLNRCIFYFCPIL
jgi:hypothetical protein